MPFKDTGQHQRWYWTQAIAWIAFHILDAKRNAISRPKFSECIGLEKREVQVRSSQAVSKMVEMVADGKLEPIWTETPGLRINESQEDFFTEWRVQTEETMLERLRGWVTLGGCPFDKLYFSRSEVLRLWPEKSSEEAVKRPSRGRSPGDGSFDSQDQALLEEMSELIASGEATSASGAATMVAGRAHGGGTIESKAKRLAGKYRRQQR